MGLISIGTWHAGTPELIDDNVSGYLVPENNVWMLANTVNFIIEHPELWKSVGLAARKKVEDEFETGQLIEKLENYFMHYLGGKTVICVRRMNMWMMKKLILERFLFMSH